MEVEGEDVYADHFSVPAHRYIYTAMLYLQQKNIEPSPMALMEVITDSTAKSAIEELDGLDYLMTLQKTYMPEDNLKIYIQKVKQAYTRRMLYNIAEDVQNFVLSEEAEVLNPNEITAFATGKIDDLVLNVTSASHEVYKMGDNTEEVLAERAVNPQEVPGLEVGMPRYDRITNGATGGDLIVVCAPSKTGKSALLKNWNTKLSIKDALPTLYIDTEMTSREQEDRMLANLTGIPHDEIVSGRYVEDTYYGTAEEKSQKLQKAKEELGEGGAYHVYMPHFSLEKVSSLVRKFQMQFGIVAVFFDYIKIPSNEASFKDAQEYQKLGFFTSGLKDLAGLLNIPVFTACQANRSEVGTTKPNEGNIGGSYRILQLATKLMFLYNKSDEQIAKDGRDMGNQQLTIAFQRNGSSDEEPINIFYDKPILRMTEAEQRAS